MDKETKVIIIILVFVFLCLIGGWIIQSNFEKNTFNKFSENKATLVDAMFAELRVINE